MKKNEKRWKNGNWKYDVIMMRSSKKNPTLPVSLKPLKYALIRIQIFHVLSSKRERGWSYRARQIQAFSDFSPYFFVNDLNQTALFNDEFVQRVQKFVADYLNLVIFGRFQNKKIEILKIAFPSRPAGSFYWAILKISIFLFWKRPKMTKLN